MNKPYFKLFASCIPVKGAVNHVLCDLQRTFIQPIPESLYVILTEMKEMSVEEIKSIFEYQQDAQIDEYYSFLEEGEWGFWCDDPTLFPELDLSWDSPSMFTNAIIDINKNSKHPYANIFRQLDQLGCQALQLRTYDELDEAALLNILGAIGDSRLIAIELVLKFLPAYSIEKLECLCQQFPRISAITLHSAPSAVKHRTTNEVMIMHTPQLVDAATHCGVVHGDYFASNLALFTEAQKHNSCLNRKISVDVNGNIKNCPSMLKSYGQISEVTFQEALAQAQFRTLWDISKDQVEICRDCEYRYVCVDCRAYTQNGELHAKPEKCKYDPYTSVWENTEQSLESVYT